MQYFQVYLDGKAQGTPVFFHHAIDWAPHLFDVNLRANIPSQIVDEMVQLFSLKRSSVTINGFAQIDNFRQWLKVNLLNAEEHYANNVVMPQNLYAWFHNNMLDSMISAQIRVPTGQIVVKSYLPLEDYHVGLVIPKIGSDCKIKTYVRLSKPVIKISYSDFYAIHEYLHRSTIPPTNFAMSCDGYIHMNFLRSIFVGKKDLTILGPKKIHDFFTFIKRFQHIAIGTRNAPPALENFINSIKDLFAVVYTYPGLYGVYFGVPFVVQKLELCCNYN